MRKAGEEAIERTPCAHGQEEECGGYRVIQG
jgi:hypothetical protein